MISVNKDTVVLIFEKVNCNLLIMIADTRRPENFMQSPCYVFRCHCTSRVSIVWVAIDTVLN